MRRINVSTLALRWGDANNQAIQSRTLKGIWTECEDSKTGPEILTKRCIMYEPSILFRRTQEERHDLFLSWNRPDKNFFAAGACHILASVFVQLYHMQGYKMIYLRGLEPHNTNHVYASNGEWAFDHCGFTLESELLETTRLVYRQHYVDWEYATEVILNLEQFCQQYHHRLPWQYLHLPWERAYCYIKSFEMPHQLEQG
jgi:hypothetical protein